jgi:crotonobetainyl-CoA:carnitine CoA-transferase CaiB-like acyl-CoA transferase
VIIGANADSMHERLMCAIGRSDLTGAAFAKNLHRVARRVETEDAIVAWTSARSRGGVLRVLDQIGGRVVNVRDIVTNEQVQERGAVESVWVPGRAHGNADESG